MSFTDLQQRARANWEDLTQKQPVIWIGAATCGLAAGAGEVIDAVRDELVRLGLTANIVPVGCMGPCYLEPLLDIEKPGSPRISYGQVTPELAGEIVKAYLVDNNPLAERALGTHGEGEVAGIPRFFDLPMLKSQVRIVTRNMGFINPREIDHYLARGGYQGLTKALGMTPEAVIEEVTEAGLRGRGGAGFPTGLKWKFARQAAGSPKYLICNADEGDPGAFMDRSVLEGDPHAVLEGMLIAAYAIGASRGYIYVRSEYPLAIQLLERALGQMREYNLLGERILGADFSFDIVIQEGAGAFVCGEETALIASIEGKRGMPRPRPPFPAQSGLWGKPTNINNVETFANLAPIMLKGAAWFAGYGTEKSKGTKTFSLTGKIKRSGLIEVPMGMSLYDVVFSVGGGILGDRKIKAVQTGGPSGGCIPARLLHLPVDYESLAAAGSIMGSGGLVVLDDNTCMVDLARYFLNFTQNESCGKCTPCRVGTRQMQAMLEDFCAGAATAQDLAALEELASTVKVASLCGLGQTAPNPVLTTLRYFREEYEEHMRSRCRAAACRALVKAPCIHSCPAGVEVPRYLRAIAKGNFDLALQVVRERIPFAWVCGLVCYHPCESRCRRAQLDEPLTIRALKRAAAEYGKSTVETETLPAPPSGKRVAIIGSGPAGLTTAYYLRKIGGHAVEVYEALPKLGGMLRVGIPRYRLPEQALDREIERIRELGVVFHPGARVEDPEAMLNDGFDAVLLAIGAHQGMKLGIPGEQEPGVIDSVMLIRRVNSGENVSLGRRVAVIGGGNTAIDAARIARRLGSEVTMLYRRGREEMPADPEEVAAALAEGIDLQTCALPRQIVPNGECLTVTCVRTELGEMDESGRRRADIIPGSEFILEFDNVVVAVGQTPDIPARTGVAIGRGRLISVDAETLRTSVPGIFAAADVVSGPSSVIDAIAAGRLAAESIDRFLGGTGIIAEQIAPPETAEELAAIVIPEAEEWQSRPRLDENPVEGRLRSFCQVEIGLSRDLAMVEALRCLNCDLED